MNCSRNSQPETVVNCFALTALRDVCCLRMCDHAAAYRQRIIISRGTILLEISENDKHLQFLSFFFCLFRRIRLKLQFMYYDLRRNARIYYRRVRKGYLLDTPMWTRLRTAEYERHYTQRYIYLHDHFASEQRRLLKTALCTETYSCFI